jgi:hypothetical protein
MFSSINRAFHLGAAEFGGPPHGYREAYRKEIPS